MNAITTEAPDAPAPASPAAQAVAVREERQIATMEPQLPATLAQAAIDPRVDPDKLERLWTLHERLEDRQAAREFTRAFVALLA